MGRAELRRQQKAKKKQTKTYNFNKQQLDGMMRNKANELMQDAKEEAVNETLTLLLALPLEVLMDYYWPKSYKKKIPEFTEHVLEYYNRWQDGEIQIEELQKDLWEYAGIRLEAIRVD